MKTSSLGISPVLVLIVSVSVDVNAQSVVSFQLSTGISIFDSGKRFTVCHRRSCCLLYGDSFRNHKGNSESSQQVPPIASSQSTPRQSKPALSR